MFASHLQLIGTVLADCVAGCVHLNVTAHGKAARSICVPPVSHVDETLAGRGVPVLPSERSRLGAALCFLIDSIRPIKGDRTASAGVSVCVLTVKAGAEDNMCS